MKKIIAAEFLTLDGVMENPAWTAPYFNDELGKTQDELLFSSEALLLGRVTYQGFSTAWPERNEGAFAERINAMPKFVASRSLSEVGWNAQLIEGDVAAKVQELKTRDGGDLLIYGSARLVEYLRAQDLIDAYRLIIFPVILGKGRRLFGDDGFQTDLRLAHSVSTSTGVQIVTYERTGE